jgi:hypothetical protein
VFLEVELEEQVEVLEVLEVLAEVYYLLLR